MRKFIKLVLSEILLYAGSAFAEWFFDGFPGWIWGIIFLLSLALLIWIYREEAKQRVDKLFSVEQTEHVAITEECETTLIRGGATVETWPNWDSGRGDVAACAIKSAPTFAAAMRVYYDWRYARHRQAKEQAVAAMVTRLRNEGDTPQIEAFLLEELAPTVDNVTESFPRDSAGDNTRRFEWMVMSFEDMWHEPDERS